jgi:hypothetical protein
MSENGWEEVEAPVGNFIGWGRVGQTVTGKVIFYTHDGGTDFNGQACPQITIELQGQADSYKEKGTQLVSFESGQVVMINAGQANLKANVVAAQLMPGNLVQIAYVGDQALPGGKSVKQFKIRVNRQAGVSTQQRNPTPPQAYQPPPTPPANSQWPANQPQPAAPFAENPPF